MPVMRVHHITREKLQAHPDILFLFGDNMRRKGLGGQAKVMRGEPNAIGIATKIAPDTRSVDYMGDELLGINVATIAADMRPAFTHVLCGGTVVIPKAGLGTGRARLEEKAPRTFKFLQAMLKALTELGELTE